MKLKKLEVIGFKSFSEKTTIQFPKGVCAVVGPNGCGKSNVVDALKWVMGEQSVKQLRGKSMEDMIFSGAAGKPALNMAEVSLTLHNDNGSAPEELNEFSEIQLTRRLFRSGESAYLINRRPCRLKDIHNIFLGSGMGVKSYAIIQQGNIGAITEAGPDERRYFVEEAAGITRYKSRKTEALRKVTATEQNLLRVNDIIAEIGRQMAGLKRQAKKAERYNRYQQQIREFDIHIAQFHFEDFSLQIEKYHQLLMELRDGDLAHSSQIKKLDAAVEAIKLERWKTSQAISDQKSTQYDTQRSIDRLENDLVHQKEATTRLEAEATELHGALVNLEAKNQEVEGEIDQVAEENQRFEIKISDSKARLDHERAQTANLRETLAEARQTLEEHKQTLMERATQEARYRNIFQNATNNKENLERRIKRADEEVYQADREVSSLDTERQATQERLAACQNEAATTTKAIERLRSELSERQNTLQQQIKALQATDLERNKVKSALGTLQKMAANYDWYRDGVRHLMKPVDDAEQLPPGVSRPAPEGLIALVADIIETETSYETAVEAVLGEMVQYILVDSSATGLESIDFLRAQQAGRSGFIPLTDLEPGPVQNATYSPNCRPLINHARTKAPYQHLATVLFDGVVLVDHVAEGLQILKENPSLRVAVSPSGDLVDRHGIIVGGSKDRLMGILQKKQELKALEDQLAHLQKRLTKERQTQDVLAEATRETEIQLQQSIEAKAQHDHTVVELEKALLKSEEALRHARRRQEIAQLDQERLLGEVSEADEEISRYTEALNEIQAEVQESQQLVEQTTQHIEKLAAEVAHFDQHLVDLKLQLSSYQTKLETGQHTLKRLLEFKADGQRRHAQMSEDIVRKQNRCQEIERAIDQAGQTLARQYDTLESLTTKLEANQNTYQQIDERLKQNDDHIRDLKKEREAGLEKLRLVELEQSQKSMQREALVEKIEERYHQSFELLTVTIETIDDEQTIGAMETEVQQLRDKVARITDVNLGAIKEYEQLKDRHDFLCEQRDDLVKAIEDLHKVIRKINRITQKRCRLEQKKREYKSDRR